MTLELSSDVMQRLLDEAANAHPRECCGVLLGAGSRIEEIVPAANVHADPGRHFEIDPQTLIDAHRAARASGPQVLGYYHSHPNGRTGPSPRDAELAADDGAVWVIIAAGGVTFWRSGDGGFHALPYVVRER